MFFLILISNLVTNSYLKSYKQFFSIKYGFLVEKKILIYIFAFEEVQSMSVTYKSGVIIIQTLKFHLCNIQIQDRGNPKWPFYS